MTEDSDIAFMQTALLCAQEAAGRGEVPVGALIVDPMTGEIVATGANRTLEDTDPTAHAEIIALRAAARARANHRLTGLTLFVTLEPCAMCAGAISHARIGRLVFGASDAKGGGVLHGPRVFDQPTCHWRPEIVSGLMEQETGQILKDFFRARRS